MFNVDVKVEFDRGQEPFWEVIDPDTGEVSYFKISQIYGVEVKEGPKEGDIVIKEEKVMKIEILYLLGLIMKDGIVVGVR